MKTILIILSVVFSLISIGLDTRKKVTTRDALSDLFYGWSLITFTCLLFIMTSPFSEPREEKNYGEVIKIDSTRNDTIIIYYHATDRD